MAARVLRSRAGGMVFVSSLTRSVATRTPLADATCSGRQMFRVLFPELTTSSSTLRPLPPRLTPRVYMIIAA